MNKIPKKYKKFDKMNNIKFAEYVWDNYHYKVYICADALEVYNYFGKLIIRGDSKKMIIYWLDFEKKLTTCEKI